MLSLPGGGVIRTLEIDGTVAGWSGDGRIYYHKRSRGGTEIRSIPAEGGTPTLHKRLDVACYRVSVSRAGTTFACDEPVVDRDVWIVEGFDGQRG